MTEGPRNVNEPLLNKIMIIGIAIQNIVLSSLCVGGYVIGLEWYVGTSVVQSSYTPFSSQVEKAQTISILLIVFAELLRALTARSLRESVFTIGFFKNMYMIYSVFGSLTITVIVYLIPNVNSFFGMHYIDGRGWGVVLIGSVIPIIIEEITKYFYRLTGLGARQKTVRYSRK